MEKNYNEAGDVLEELRKAGEMECCLDESTPLSITEAFGPALTLFCC